ncbi:hypothetical protein HD806DRAFT_23471 [Xylariaceae sp. AK1471]|nr:hypothetical protein HD806DRAFT_23471 [Xylariaceae sp. AK1471]
MAPPTYIPLPDWKEQYKVNLGDLIYALDRPEKALLRLHDSDMALDEAANPVKLLGPVRKCFGDGKSTKYGIFAKVLEVLSFGLNASYTSSNNDTETYNVGKVKVSTFNPSVEFLDKLVKVEKVDKHLKNSESRRAFLVTGILTGTDIVYAAKSTQDQNQEGDIGLNVQGVAFGPSGKLAKKKFVETDYTDPGPSPFALRVLKIHLGPDDQVLAGEFREGAKFGAGDVEPEMEFGAELDSFDKLRMVDALLADDDGDMCLLVAPAF